MPVKYFGIYLAYAPGVDLRHEGLGRYLAAFLKGASEREDVRFVLVCPSWSKEGLAELFESEGVSKASFDVVAPDKEPMVLRLYEAYKARKERRAKSSLMRRISLFGNSVKMKFFDRVERRLVEANSYSDMFSVFIEGFLLSFLLVLVSPLLLIGMFCYFCFLMKPKFGSFFKPITKKIARLRRLLRTPKDDALVLRLYNGIARVEADRMLKLVDGLSHVKAWYSPTAFWPAFNKIKAPRVMCVPDVVLSDFPVAFSTIGGNRFAQVFYDVKSAIEAGSNYITYSNAVKWSTLVEQFGVRGSNVSVIHHAPNDLSPWVAVNGYPDNESTSINYCEQLFKSALKRSSNPDYTSGFGNVKVDFIFYASQFRPNKNVISLLRAYESLLRKRLIKHKLILTGRPEASSEVKSFIKKHHLENDVLCLHGLSIQQLAACYKLADLVVNPSLSEGGCPFTFTEALSVSTPVVMARIPVSEEVLTDPELQDVTFFDPYSWEDIADKIEWALDHREHVLKVQSVAYQSLAERSWANVVDEHIDVLLKISKTDKVVEEVA
ncbi:glycosyltransferase [Pseudomonas izuensis]|uniref:Glycoside hydrolase n=1 Tax=Pseudomonas izuensis TaxID=2684212 RepID=A0ABM7RM50_9PSED|nr:glycosyltransferase [Pseudomonas izuensis]BCX66890.1 glycoside hydrolase [Pseudomonas izuensis]